MTEKFGKNSRNPLVQLFKSLFNKLIHTSDIYPVRYYKKGKRFRRP